MYVCACVCMCVFMFVRLCEHEHPLYVCVHVCVCARDGMCIRACAYIACTYMYASMRVCVQCCVWPHITTDDSISTQQLPWHAVFRQETVSSVPSLLPSLSSSQLSCDNTPQTHAH